MNKELMITGILIALSTVLKICSVVALCTLDMHHDEHEHHHQLILEQRRTVQTSHKLLG